MYRPIALAGLVLACLAAAVLPDVAHAQTFTVRTTDPAHGAASVPLVTTVRFEFELPDDGNSWSVYEVIDFNTALRVEPRGAIRLGQPQLLLNDAGRPAVITYDVHHAQETDYTWLVYDVLAARPGAGGFVTIPMSQPHVLRYTTSGSIGQQTVAGTVAEADVAAHHLPAPTRTLLRGVAEQVRRQTAPGDVAAKLATEASARPPHRMLAEGDVTHVYLLPFFTLTPQTRAPLAATVVAGTSGAFAVDYVRPGTYWPLAVRFLDVYQTEIAAIGYYDADGDGQPDPVTVEAGDLDAVDLTLYAYEAFDAAASLDRARAAATAEAAALGWSGTPQLTGIRSAGPALPDGRAYRWTYTFASGDEGAGEALSVDVDPLGAEAYVEAGLPQPTAPALPDAFTTTSTEAAALALADGGSAFLTAYAPNRVTTAITTVDLEAEGAAWLVSYTGTNGFGTEVFERYVSLEAEAVINVAAERPEEEPTQAMRLSVYPNPTRGAATVRFRVEASPSPGAVRAAVYDLLGREVAGLAVPAARSGLVHTTWDGRDAAGRAVAPGLYVVRVSTPAGVQATPVTVVR